ncbi:hypothetical protein T484DRAFT_3551522 [Baffinella frigidus]|nr:hypothetical protein T484DRAFT_3551522 [Cryptophyta sp. CCMP2293]
MASADVGTVDETRMEVLVVSEIEAVQEVVVCGGGRQYLACLLTLKCVPGDAGALAEPALRFARASGSQATTVEEARRCQFFRSALLKGFANCNKLVYESSKRTGLEEKPSQLRRYAILSEQFSVEGGTLHPDGRVNRPRILDQFTTVVESMYGAVATNKTTPVVSSPTKVLTAAGMRESLTLPQRNPSFSLTS